MTDQKVTDLGFARLAPLERTAKFAFREGWRWSTGIHKWFVRETSRLDLVRPLVHICSGASKLGDIRVDKFHPLAGVRGDVFALPFADSSLPSIVIDPPYDLPLRERVLLGKEIARVHAPGGRLSWKAPWLPMEGHYLIHDVTVATTRTGLPRDAHLLVRAERRFPGPKKGKGQKNAAQRQRTIAQGNQS